MLTAMVDCIDLGNGIGRCSTIKYDYVNNVEAFGSISRINKPIAGSNRWVIPGDL